MGGMSGSGRRAARGTGQRERRRGSGLAGGPSGGRSGGRRRSSPAAPGLAQRARSDRTREGLESPWETSLYFENIFLLWLKLSILISKALQKDMATGEGSDLAPSTGLGPEGEGAEKGQAEKQKERGLKNSPLTTTASNVRVQGD